MTQRKISVVLPVYREAENIGPCLRGLWSALRDEAHEILVCYDFEEDPTLAAVAAMADRPPTVRLIRNDLGRGPANAIRAGFRAAEGDLAVTVMADLSDPPEVILAMAREIRERGADVVAGSRYMKGGSQTGGPRLKTWLSRAAGLSLHWLAGLGTHDATTNFRAFSRRFLDQVEIESTAGFQVALELTVKAHLGGFRVSETPSHWRDRPAGESQFRLRQWLPGYLHWYWLAMRPPLARGGAWAFAALLWLNLLAFPTVAPSGELDNSWQQEYLQAFRLGLQYGRDYVFTYGPLTAFYVEVYDPAFFPWRIGWEIALKAGFALLLLAALPRRRGATERLLGAGALLLLPAGGQEAMYFAAAVAAGVVALREPPRWRWALPIAAVWAAVSLTKFTLLVGVVGALALAAATQWRRGGAAAWRLLALFPAAWLALGLAARQSPSALAQFLRWGSAIAGVYADGASLPTADAAPLLAAAAALVLLALLCLSGVTARPREATRGAVAALLLGWLLFVWKACIVRDDESHRLVFAHVAAVLPFLAPGPPAGARRLARVRLGLLALFAAVWLGWVAGPAQARRAAAALPDRLLGNARLLLAPGAAKAALDRAWRAAARRHELPRLRAVVGDRPADAFTACQGYLFLNNLTWRPRPVLQSYAAFSPPLLERNRDFYLSARAPDYVLMRVLFIDRHFPTLEDGLALRVILRDYRPLFEENGVTLWRRSISGPGQPLADGEPALRRRAALGEPVACPDPGEGRLTLSVDLRPSWRGRLWTFLYKPPPVFLEIGLDDRLERHRLAPNMARSPFLFSPLLMGSAQTAGRGAASSDGRVRWFRLVVEGDPAGCYEPDYALELRREP